MKKQILMFALCCLTACSSSSATKENEAGRTAEECLSQSGDKLQFARPFCDKGR